MVWGTWREEGEGGGEGGRRRREMEEGERGETRKIGLLSNTLVYSVEIISLLRLNLHQLSPLHKIHHMTHNDVT